MMVGVICMQLLPQVLITVSTGAAGKTPGAAVTILLAALVQLPIV
jgi:hypothetical protein